MLETKVSECKFVLVQDADVARNVADSKSTSSGMLCMLGDHTCVQIPWTGKKKTAVSHNSTEAEVISLPTGLRMEGFLALTSWDVVVGVLETLASRTRSDPSRHFTSRTSHTTQETIDHVPPNVQESSNRVHLLFFEKDEAGMKIIIKGMSARMRHVSRKHRVNMYQSTENDYRIHGCGIIN